MDPGRALRRWSDTQHNSLCLPHSHCLQSQAQLYSKLGQQQQDCTILRQRLFSFPAGRGWREKGRSLCFSHVASPSRRDDGRYFEELHSKGLNGATWPGLTAFLSCSHGSTPGYSHPTTAVCIPCSLESYAEKPTLPSALFCSQKLKKKKKDVILSLCKHNTFNFTSFSLQHKEGKDRKSIRS